MQHQDTGLQFRYGGGNANELAEVLVTGNGEENAPAPSARPASSPDKKDRARGQFQHLVTDAAEQQAAEIGATPGAEDDEIGSVFERCGSDLPADMAPFGGMDLGPSVDRQGDEALGHAGYQRQTFLGLVAVVHVQDHNLGPAAHGQPRDRQQRRARGSGAICGKEQRSYPSSGRSRVIHEPRMPVDTAARQGRTAPNIRIEWAADKRGQGTAAWVNGGRPLPSATVTVRLR